MLTIKRILKKLKHPDDFYASLKRYYHYFVKRKILLLIVSLNIKHIYGPAKVEYEPTELIVLCLVRDGELYIKSFIEHYFSLGAKHVIFLDNGSTDETVSIAKERNNVTILRTKLPYKRYTLAMREYLIRRFGKRRWSLYVDIDELFDYPYSETVSLTSFLRYLNQRSFTAVVTQVLDMFDDKPLLNYRSEISDSLKDLYKWHDISNITKSNYGLSQNIVSNNQIKWHLGGIRKIIFGTEVNLTNHRLIFLDAQILPMHPGNHSVKNARIADLSCVLYHYKFLGDFYERTVRIVQEESYYQNSREYKKYLNVLEQNPDLQIKQETSQRLKSVNDLIESEFLVISAAYRAWAEKNKS